MRDVKNLSIDEANLDREMAEQSAMFVYATCQYVQTEKDYKDFKLQVEQLESSLALKHRDRMKAAGEKATEKALTEAVCLEPDYIKAQRHLNDLWAKKEVLRALSNGWEMRSRMIQQMAAKQRSELESLARSTLKTRDDELVEANLS